MRATLVLTAIALLASCARVGGAGFNYSMWLAAHPQAIVADGRSDTTISAEVRDSSGRPVPDGTVVDFTTSLGTIERTARTTAGVARVRLESDTSIGTALVSAVVAVGNAVAQLRVDFLEPGTEMFDESFISVSSKNHLGYDVGTRVIDSAGGVKIYHRGLTITAEEAQIDARRMVLKAKARMGGENIIVERGDKHLEASVLYYDFNSMSGKFMAPAEEGAARMNFRGRDLYTEEDEEPAKPNTFSFEPVAESTMFIKAESLIIRPGEEIKFKRAVFYLEGDRLLSMPLHVEPLRGQATGVNRILTYGTEGLRLDLPFYYSLTANGTGALRLRHSQPGGWGYYSGNSGWQLDLEQEYTQGGSTEGKFLINRITSGDWGARWTQRKEFDDDSRLYTYLDFPAHRSLYASADYSRSLGDYNLSLNLRGNKMKMADGRYSTAAYLQSRPKPLLNNAFTYSFTTRLSFDSYTGEGAGRFGSGLGLQVYGKPLRFGDSANLNSSLSINHDFTGAFAGTSVNANLGYYQSIGRIGRIGVNYSYALENTGFDYSAHRISTDISLAPSNKWRAYLYTTYGIGDSSTSAFGELSYMFMPTWRIHLLGTYQKFGDYSYRDAEFALAKAIGNQEARLVWSQSRKRFRVEFSALSF